MTTKPPSQDGTSWELSVAGEQLCGDAGSGLLLIASTTVALARGPTPHLVHTSKWDELLSGGATSTWTTGSAANGRAMLFQASGWQGGRGARMALITIAPNCSGIESVRILP